MVFVLDKHKKPLMPCSEKRARKLLKQRKAVIYQLFPFTIRLKNNPTEKTPLPTLRLKIDPGAKITGLAVLVEESNIARVIWLGELVHKIGITEKLEDRRNRRRNRRNRKTRYREKRFNNRKREKGWLPPSLVARVNQTINTIEKLCNLLPISSISVEHVKFDTQLMENPYIKGIEYQQGTLFGYEIKEYLLEVWNRTCAYCEGKSKDPILNVEHVIPKNPKQGPCGTNRLQNLVLSCRTCNELKSNKHPEDWLEELKKSKKEIDQTRAKNLAEITKRNNKSLKEATFMNATRWHLLEKLKQTELPVECGTGARTKMQRIQHHLPKTHYYDASCVGASTPQSLIFNTDYVEQWIAIGRGSRQIMQPDAYGFPRQYRSRNKQHFGFQTGDIVEVILPEKSKNAGRYVGRVTTRKNGKFYINKEDGKRLDFSYKYARVLQRGNGWNYDKKKRESIHA
ncbi:HNH endonuclease [Neobacillus sp. YIM B02564]|uniref:HNH endonuclease n=1 Tax=Neobacillus paridis TaxID=2803862 RepID=A0ABS1TL53_9BACI|nr:RNA-guided endonuclease IscB [Neobacillus paridis]MBL4952042.1 HNH endonuclease [Neobacillus paridis]